MSNRFAPNTTTTYRFGGFLLNVRERLLTRDGTAVPIAPKVFETLAILVEEEGRLVRRAELIERLWPDSFVEDATLARNISDLRKILGESGSGQKFIETVPRIGYRFAAPIEKVQGCESDAPPDGVKIGAPAQNAKSSRAWLAVGLCVVVAALAWAAWRTIAGGARGPGVKTIAVLPFLSLDAVHDDAMTGQELADALIMRLSLSDLVVRSTSSVLAYGSRTRDPIAAGRQLQVDAILDGSIQRQAETERITVRLLSVHSGRSLWAGTFDEPLNNVFALEDSVSQRVASALSLPGLRMPLQQLAKADSGNEAAKLAYYNGRYWFEKRTQQGLLQSISCYQQAAAADPHYARAYSGLAESYLLLSGYGFASQDDYVPRAREAAKRALALDASLGEAHSALALVAENYDLDWSRAEAEYKTAIELNPRYPTARHLYGEYLAYMGRFREGRAELERAKELDPTSLIIAADYAETFLLERRYRQGTQLLQGLVHLDPTFVRARIWLADGLMMEGECSEAFSQISALERIEDGAMEILPRGLVAAKCGDRTKALAAIAQLSKVGYDSSFGAGIIFAALDDKDQAFLWLNRAIQQRQIGLINLKENPLFDTLRKDPRYAVLLARVRLPS